MTVDELMRRPVVAVLALTLGQHVLFVRLHHREPLDRPKKTAEARFSCHVPISDRHPPMISIHCSNFASKLVSKQNYRLPTPLSI